ncbi:ubiquinol-cytochrome c reductase ubiquinone-binding protein [Andrena cerasifolii]|uniref:ubiquinol-cytochrome c reductase ubiquinone-binding protein n=1 Tax=Andrena cerasifolii TaxID=2819439 RepID=UPI0040383B73
MGKEFGNLDTIRGVTFFRLSPFEQKAFGGMIKDGVPNMVRRFNGSVLRVAPFFIGTYMLIAWADEENWKLNRKNPKDFENDV